MPPLYPSYLNINVSNEWPKRIKQANLLLENCSLCPRLCGVNRLKNQKGICQAGLLPKISSFNAHFGEEPPISGKNGSGTIFFTHCNLKCVYCQNYPISQLGHGEEVSFEKLAQIMLILQKQNCHNVNFVTPTIYIPQILQALEIAIKKGFNLPLVYNSGGYEDLSSLKLLDGIIDIYMPDAKYSDDEMSVKYSAAPNYFSFNKKALLEMHRQVGDLQLDREGIAIRGLLIRHLVLPNNISGSKEVLHFIATQISKNTYISLMSQYHPAHRAYEFKELSRRLTQKEYDDVLQILHNEGLEKGWIQEL